MKDKVKKEPVSGDLEEEIEKCLKRHNMLAVGKKDFTDIAKHFANWQREQMMKDAIDVKINRDTLYDLKPFIHEKYLDYKIGDKCKMILIKEN